MKPIMRREREPPPESSDPTQTSGGNPFDRIHYYLYKKLPLLKSRIHPLLVICNAGAKLEKYGLAR